MAPERARGKRGDARSDVYALGAVMHELLTGAHVFEGNTPMAVLVNQMQQTPDRPSLANEAVPDYVDAIVLRCLQREPDQRFPDMTALLKALVAAEDRLLRAQPTQSWE